MFDKYYLNVYICLCGRNVGVISPSLNNGTICWPCAKRKYTIIIHSTIKIVLYYRTMNDYGILSETATIFFMQILILNYFSKYKSYPSHTLHLC